MRVSPQRARLTFTGDAALRATREGAVRGLLLGAEHVLTEARKRVPIDEGTLERSGTVSVDEQDLTAAVAFDTPYATRQHEELTHQHAPGRSAKYLERPMTDEAATVTAIIAAQVRRALR
ncbi:minor capsid protein [Streptomyces alboflavus]|uniref:minor capsid protein n=1 Tax=Streptomyces alboflavus TaxID=67267 RepID=UPI00367D9DA7